jgi:hypothetical protein
MNRIMIAFLCLSMISAQTLRVCREEKPVPTFSDHAHIFVAEPDYRAALRRDQADRTYRQRQGARNGQRRGVGHETKTRASPISAIAPSVGCDGGTDFMKSG